MRLTGICLYPVKSLAGISVLSADLDTLGLVGDRRFLVVDENGRFLTQRTLPRMALITTALDPTHLTLSVSPTASIRIARASDPTAALDAASENTVLALLQKLRDQGKTIIIAAHHPAVLAIADHVVHLTAGVVTRIDQAARAAPPTPVVATSGVVAA